MNRSMHLQATVIATALVLTLAGCGRKGGLDPPPGGHRLDAGTIRTRVTPAGEPRPKSDKPPDYDADGRPIVPEAQKKQMFLDWLID